ncbi:serine hydrolase domain-containing protein [Spongiimicrobium sp. 2-473A-2-J]|uniref:serine hydrolase domain-containing protein n=1 Tax=Eudoraea algarum TaxID=3417568 RepID=UPI003D3614DF
MKTFKRVLALLILFVIGVAFFNYSKLNIISGYAAKNMASTLYIAQRTEHSVNENDNRVPLIKMAETVYDESSETVSASVFGLMERQAICRDGLGCALVLEDYEIKENYPKPNRQRVQRNVAFPYGDKDPRDTLLENVDYAKLKEALDDAFALPDKQKTRTVLVLHKGQIIAERYVEGFNKDTPILGWSMTKSVLATLYGILEYRGGINVHQYRPFHNSEEASKASITLNHLLRMQSGLAWEEDYTKISDVTLMLFLAADMTKPQENTEMIAAPTEVWNYSSGTSNMLSGILRKQFNNYQEYLDFPYEVLIDKIGMHSMLIETDLSGNFVGSSYGWASTRDWAKFGLLYLNRGNWNGEQIFDPSWVDYIQKPTEHSDDAYGAHFWLNAGGKYPDVPRDLFSANGYQGQHVFIIPSKDLVVVRTGLAESPKFDANGFLAGIVAALR